MESLAKNCTSLKQEYDECFQDWYSNKFLNGITENDCKEKFEKYNNCLIVNLKIYNQHELKQRNLLETLQNIKNDNKKISNIIYLPVNYSL